jgi:curved DNA-binding protein CbpA
MERPAVPSPLIRFGLLLVFGGLALVLALLLIARRLPDRGGAATPAPRRASLATAGQAESPTAVQRPTAEELGRAIAAAWAVLRDPNHADKAGALAALRAAFAQADPKVAIVAIRQFLKSGQDGSTGLRFQVGDGGLLTETPTLRTFLMDQLGSLSQEAQTADAAEVARETLSAMTSADEWALAMRNVAWADPEGSKPYLADKVRAMLNYAPWQQNPTGGYLEAFDVAAYSGDGSLAGDLANLTQTSSSLKQAALVALERLSALAPAQTADYLNANPGVLSATPLLRADYMGNLNLSDPTQDAEAETYLNRPDVTEAEKEKFLARLATPAGFLSDNLLTPSNTSTMTIFQHQAMVNQAASGWLASGSFPTLTAPLQALIQRTAQRAGGS